MRELSIDAGVGDIELRGIGFANFEEFSFDGGIGDVDIDLSGFGDGFGRVDIEIGLGEAHITIPEGVPLRIEANDGLLNSIEIHGDLRLSKSRGVYVSDDFERGTRGLDIRVEVGLGEAEIRIGD
jgi:hypothetical protein